MSATLPLLLLLWTACEAAGQILFKHGMDRLEGADEHFTLGVLGLALRSPLIWGGIIVHAVEFAVWMEVLAQAPLSVAFPLESISFVTVVAATRLFLREKVPPRRWVGIGLICLGIVVLGMSS
jgi:multidrug transporter EmrE-like cation transporter